MRTFTEDTITHSTLAMKRYLLPAAALLIVALSAGCHPREDEALPAFPDRLTDFVDPWIGTGGHGHVFLGANVPFGMVQLGPTSVSEGWDWCSGYHISDSTIIGFSHTHMSGTGIGDLLDVTVMPVVGAVTPGRGTLDDPASGQWSCSDRGREVVRPGYYATRLSRYGIDVELTATDRVGLHRYRFPEGAEQPAVIIDLANGGNWDALTDCEVTRVSDTRLEGFRRSTGWARDQRVFFAIELSTPIDEVTYGTAPTPGKEQGKAKYNYAVVRLRDVSQPVVMKVALSPTSEEDAWKNMSAECPDGDFDRVKAAADELWEKALGRLRMASADSVTLVKLYTALYHTLFTPSDYCNADGSYLGSDFERHDDPGYTTRTTFSLWDTYRAFHPLYTLIHADRMSDIAGTMTAISREGGKVPVWHFYANETNTMVGDPGICVLADAIVKGLCDDPEAVYAELKKTALLDERGKDLRRQYGYIPYELMNENTAFDMEYAIADRALAEAAKYLGHEEDCSYFLKMSKTYRQHFDPETGFMRGKSARGEWHVPFDPAASNHREDDYCEGNAWQYTFLVPQDVEGLADCFGGEERLIAKLDSLFAVSSEVTGDNASPDISGLIGQYAHGNEPGHHTIYLYSVLGRQSKAAPLLRRVMTELYHADPDGLSGNEDAGQMSAWYLLSAIGLYQAEPAGGRYYFGSPIVDRAVLAVRDGTFDIRVHDNSADHIYIERILLNGEEYTARYLDYEAIARGGVLDVYMGSEPRDF